MLDDIVSLCVICMLINKHYFQRHSRREEQKYKQSYGSAVRLKTQSENTDNWASQRRPV